MEETNERVYEPREAHGAPKRLYRSDTNYVIGGICGGLGEYFNVDPAIFRIGWIAMTALSAVVPGILAYILALLVVPPRRHS
jgi:phage shock protein C